ncbi:uncharacterized protein LACBIDRAFT_335767 [Laccaria bicolor S238N-H82]|uniref:Predicted protein n=1 Tax=Laccaria bicolor (strain S238N-H82 / ATCC MYA-4686) TaxID=486041 RepID=B0E3C3_LACBS|nr:uncharacterized protein LACBIDRAFT_335767 [Laccaria bicolor S238N-H82]EDQ98660.1 predicted protein [Laccaria bicolor S238N-H82]|eukprot:XP_001890692.1 predicted protein [Laccaria bicolor S238N-H82]
MSCSHVGGHCSAATHSTHVMMGRATSRVTHHMSHFPPQRTLSQHERQWRRTSRERDTPRSVSATQDRERHENGLDTSPNAKTSKQEQPTRRLPAAPPSTHDTRTSTARHMNKPAHHKRQGNHRWRGSGGNPVA